MKNKILILMFMLFGIFGFFATNVKADIYLDNDAYVIDFSNNNYDENDMILFVDLVSQLIDFFEVEVETNKIITDTDFINTNLNHLEIEIFNNYNTNDDYGVITGFVLEGFTDNLTSLNFTAYISDFGPVITNDIDDYYVNFDILLPPFELYSSLHGVINFFVQPFLDLITDIGVGDNVISIGFGSIEWFNFTLLELSNLILSFLVILIFLKVIFRLLKLVVRIITGGAINI